MGKKLQPLLVVRWLFLDPGNRTGWAYFEGNELKACGVWSLKRMLSEQCAPPGCRVVIEQPIVYTRKKSKAKPSSVVKLSITVGRLAAKFEARGCKVEYVFPVTWKGTVPKGVMNKRVQKEAAATENCLISSAMSGRSKKPDHNMLDGIGIGFWKHRRL